MAIKPNDGEVFLREVDEELRKEQLNRFVARWGWWIIAGIVLFLGAVGGWIWWQQRQQQIAGEQGAALVDALDRLEAGNRAAAAPIVDELAASDVDGYRAAGLFVRANSALAAGNAPAALATLREIAADESLAEPYRHAALVRQTQLEFDSLQPGEVVRRLRPLARPGEPWFGSAGEMMGIALIRAGRTDQAGRLFGQIARDETVPASIRSRAVQMAGSLGVNALGEAEGGESPAPAAAAPATKEKSE